jgi:flagellar motor protein MotB
MYRSAAMPVVASRYRRAGKPNDRKPAVTQASLTTSIEVTRMKALGITGTAILSVLLAVAAPAWAQEQHEQEQKANPAKHEEQKAQPEKSAKPAKQKAQPAKSAKPAEKPAAQQEKNAKPEEKNAQQHTMQAQPEKQAPQTGGGRIPADRFKANFGQQHRFRVSQGDYRNHRFQYGGYSFGFVDPWPSNWLYTQDVYVIEIDGVYYLCNPMYPGVNIALSIIL